MEAGEKIDLETGEILPNPTNRTGGFFGVNLGTVNSMVQAGAGAEELMAYIVLARGVNARTSRKVSTHGANSIAQRTGLSYRRAEQALGWLSGNQVAGKTTASGGSPVPKKLIPKWELKEQAADMYLANSLTDGIGEGKKNPPLMRIYNDVRLGSSGLMADARLDALMVLLRLYQHQDLQGCGGINPRAGIYREWQATENAYGKQVTELDGTNAALYEIEGGSDWVVSKFAAEALFYIPDESERMARFWDAMRNLEHFGFIYEVTQIWSANPNGNDGGKAEPLYTLYIDDYHARQSEPYLQRTIHEVAINRGEMDGAYCFSEDDDSSVINTGRFRYIGTRKNGGFPIGIYRLRFRPKTRDTGIGMEAERKRVANWENILKKLR